MKTFLVALSLVASFHVVAQVSYPMACRGKGEMRADYVSTDDLDHREVRIFFKKAPQAARVKWPALGECAWLDRPLTSAEPNLLHWSSRHEHISSLRIQNGELNILGVKGESLKNLLAALMSENVFFVQAYNDRDGKLVITRVGP